MNSNIQAQIHRKQATKWQLFWKEAYKSKYLYFMFLPVLAYYIIFCYSPMYGLVIAFKNFSPYKGMWKSPWVGLDHFRDFIDSVYFWRLIRNTITINLYDLLVGFPIPILLALFMNEVANEKFKRSVQTIVYLPHFISTVVICGMLVAFLSPSSGIINNLRQFLGKEPIHYLAEPGWFKTVYIWSGIWQHAGWGSIIYLASLSGIDVQLYEAATVDGATNWQKLIHITIPGIVPTIIIMLILRIGSLFSIGFEKIMLLYNPTTYETADVISTYVYRMGILGGNFSYSTAIGLFNSIINFTLLVTFNKLSRRLTEISLW